VNVADLVRDAARERPDAAAVVFRGRSITFAELDDRVDLAAAALSSLGVAPGDRVAIVVGNVPEFVDALYGAMRAGGVPCPLDVRLTPPELASILADAGARIAVTELDHLPAVLEAREQTSDLATVVVIGGPPAPAGTVSLEEALARAGDPPRVETTGEDAALLAYTAGTTSAPKGATLTHRNLLANVEQMSAVPLLSAATDDTALVALPLSHLYALNAVLGLFLGAGGTVVLVDRFDPLEAAELVERQGVTALFGAPPMFAAWLGELRAGTLSPSAFGSVRIAASGAAPLPAEVLNGFREAAGVTIWEGYGLTEAAPTVTTTALGAAPKAGSIGQPLPGLELRLVDEHDEDVEEDDPGEILVRGPNVFAGYWNRPDETEAVLDGDGWLHTGDVAYRDEDGDLFLVDRKTDLIIVSGFNVYPHEIEEAICAYPGVAEAAVAGIRDDRTGEAVEAWVVPSGSGEFSEAGLYPHLESRLARFKLPKMVNVVDELPHHVTGKVLRRVLRAEQEADATGTSMDPQPGR
jgi:long-chain acyl-CoA synthetase